MRILGRQFGLFVQHGGTFDSVGLSTGCTLTVNADVVEMASWSKTAKGFKTGRYQYTLTVDKLYGGGDMERWLFESMTQGKVLPFILGRGKAEGGRFVEDWRYGEIGIGGEVLVTGFTMTAPVDGYTTASVSFQGTGDLFMQEFE